MANRMTCSQAQKARTRTWKSEAEREAETVYLRQKRAEQILLRLKEIGQEEQALTDELWGLMQKIKEATDGR